MVVTRRTMALALVLAGGCDDPFAGGSSTVAPHYTTITYRDLRELGPDELLSIELDGVYARVFEFDSSERSIDFSRLEITTTDVGPMSMSLWLARQAARHEVDLEGLPSGRFRLTNDRSAGVAGLAPMSAESQGYRACTAVDVVELDAVVGVLFVDEGC